MIGAALIGLWLVLLRLAYGYDLPCYHNGQMYFHKEKSIDYNFPCIYYQCDNGRWIKEYSGCLFNGQCYKVGARWIFECNLMKCELETPSENEKIFRTDVTKPGCSFHGECKRDQEVWTKDCVTYKCDVSKVESQDGGDPMYVESVTNTVACKWEDECVNEGVVRKKDCQWYKCHVTGSGESAVGKMVLETKGCYGLVNRSSCLIEGEREPYVCSTYICKDTGSLMQMVLEQYGCKDGNNVCVYEGETHSPTPCIQHSCTREGWATDQYGITIIIIWKEQTGKRIECSLNDQCVKVGDSVFDSSDCSNKTCTMTKKGRGTSKRIIMDMKVTSSGCKANGECKNINDTWIGEECTEYRCVVKGQNIYPKGRRVRLAQHCKDLKGECHEVNSERFTYVYESNTYSNCRCTNKGVHQGVLSCNKS